MNSLTMIWVASVVGALLFACAGFFSARATKRTNAVDEELLASERARDRVELTHAVARAEQAEELARAARAEAERSTHQLVETRAAAGRSAEELAQMKSVSEQAAADLANAKAAAERTARELAQKAESVARAREALEERANAVVRLEKELASAKSRAAVEGTRAADGARLAKRVTELEAAVASAKSELEAANAKERRLADMLDQTRSRSSQLEAELESARGASEALRRDAALRAEESSAAKQALESAREEVASLRRGNAELSELKARLADLEKENERLRAAEFATRARARSEIDLGDAKSPPEPPAKKPTTGLDGVSLQRFVDDVVKEPAVSAAAVTDELGFLVVGNGDYTEALAAFGAYLTEAGARACGLLPMHSVQEVSVQDDTGIRLTARTIASEPNELVLVTLGVESGRGREKIADQRERSS